MKPADAFDVRVQLTGRYFKCLLMCVLILCIVKLSSKIIHPLTLPLSCRNSLRLYIRGTFSSSLIKHYYHCDDEYK